MALSINSNSAIFYGILLGDGCLSLVNKKKFVVITCGLDDDLLFFENVVSPLLKELRQKESHFRLRHDSRSIQIPI